MGYAGRRVSHHQQRGLGKPETCNFVGFTLISGRSRRGAFLLKRKCTLAAEALLEGEAEGLTRKAIEAAQNRFLAFRSN
jgi:hypothetical protein